MENMNLLDLNNDILNIIGGYVKQDNNIREFNELIKKEIFDYVDNEIKKIRKNSVKKYIGRPDLRMCIYWIFSKKQINNDAVIDEYLTLKKLNLKRK